MAITIETSIWIDKPRNEVFNYMTTAENMPTYVPGMRSARREGDGVGARVTSSLTVMGRPMEVTAEWTRYEPGTALGVKNVEGIGMESLATLHEENGGTRLERVMNLKPEGFFGTLASPLIRRTAERNARTEFETLKDLLETA